MTTNEITLYIRSLNAKTADSGFELVEDSAHWAEYGITTVSQLEDYFQACAEKEARKASYMED